MVHLFVRRGKKTQRGTAQPFTYCGELRFLEWEGDKPITVQWQLLSPLPAAIWSAFGVGRHQ